MLELLQELGLTAAEAKTYLALLEVGESTAGPIIKRAQLHRATVYDALKRLIEKGLVRTVLRGKIRRFAAAEPTELLNQLDLKSQKLKAALPELIALKKLPEQEVTVYEGLRGLQTVLDRILGELKSGGSYDDFGVSGLFRERLPAYWDKWQDTKKKYKIASRCIFDEELKSRNPKFLRDYFGEARFQPHEFASLTDTMIYKDTVVLFIWTAKPPIAVLLKNKENAEGYRRQFEFMWQNAKS